MKKYIRVAMLGHPAISRLEKTPRQHLFWPSLSQDVKKHVMTCHTCQIAKKMGTKYGELPEKDLVFTPWQDVCVDLIGTYRVEDSSGKKYSLLAMTMANPVSSWFKVAEISDKSA